MEEPLEKQDSPIEQKTRKDVFSLLLPFLEQTTQKYGSEISGKIKQYVLYRQNRTFNLFVSEKTNYISTMWTHMQQILDNQSPHLQNMLVSLLTDRQQNIVNQIEQDSIEIVNQKYKYTQLQDQAKKTKANMLRDQSTAIQKKLNQINMGMTEMKNVQASDQSRLKPFQITEQKIKEYEQFVKKQRKQKQERQKLIQEQRKKQQQNRIKKQNQMKQIQQKLVKQRKEQLQKKMKQNEQKRQKQKEQRQQRQKQYKYISKSMAQQPPLFKKLQINYFNRYQKSQNQRRSKVMSERHSMFQHNDNKSLDQHEKRYQQTRQQKQRIRKQRLEETERILELQQEQLQSKYKSNYQFKTSYINQKDEQRKLALEKRQKIKKYIEETVKEKYLPKIDESKRKQFLKLIEQMGKKKVKKVKKDDGTYEYEQVKPSDSRMLGLQYLQKTKQMAAKMRGHRKNSQQIIDTSEKPKIFDYLSEMRKKHPSMTNRDNRLNFVNKKDLTFDQKLKKIQLQSDKLEDLAKQKEMKLKYGKFSTSDQILQHKEEIDQHYIDIINMKLKLINFKDQ